jgi:hypothetical protein
VRNKMASNLILLDVDAAKNIWGRNRGLSKP